MAHSKAKLKSNGDRGSHTLHLIPKIWTRPKHRDDSLTYRVVCPNTSWPALLVSLVYLTDKFDKSTYFPTDDVMEMLPKIFYFKTVLKQVNRKVIQWNIPAFQPLNIFIRQPKRIRFFIGSPKIYPHPTQVKVKAKVRVKLPSACHEGVRCSVGKASRILNLRTR